MEPVIGLEIHTQLNTLTKLFCSCATAVGDEPNSHICEVCSGQPGSLPRTNGKAVELAAKAGLALGCTVNERSVFSRKSYFYPDLPGGFQTSQLDPPICQGGGLTLADGKFIRLNRIHLEDDAGKCVHDEARGQTLVDLNRAGTPLIEIVTEPDFRAADEAVEFLKKLHAILLRLGVTLGRMEEGEFRCDVNISLRPDSSAPFGSRCEIKNLKWPRPSSMKRCARSVSMTRVKRFSGRPASSTRPARKPAPCAPRRKPRITATSPSLISRPFSSPGSFWRNFARKCRNCRRKSRRVS